MIYLDYAAATPTDPAVVKAMSPYWTERFYNPSASYLAAQAVADDLAAARAEVAQILGARSPEIIFTAGATEANNLVINGIMQQYPKGQIALSAIEHPSVSETAKQYDRILLPITKGGQLDLMKISQQITDETVLISVMLANNEIGTIQPVAQLCRQVAKIRQQRTERGINLPLYVHTDASQAANFLDLHVHRLGVDFMTLNGGKMYGPKQSGALFVKTGIVLNSLLTGGGQEAGLRSGTQNVAASIGLATALRLAQSQRLSESKRLTALRHYFERGLASMPNTVLHGGGKRLPNIVHVAFLGQDNERLMMALDEAGFLCAVGSACSASKQAPSTVLAALGLTEEEASASLRFSLGRSSKKSDIDKLLKVLPELIHN